MWVTDDHRGNQRVKRNYSFALCSEANAYLYFYTESVPKTAHFKWQFINLSSSLIRSSMIHESNQSRLSFELITLFTFLRRPAQRMSIYLQREYSLDTFRLPISSSVDFQSAATWRSEVDILFILVGRWPRLTRDFHRSTGTRLIKSEMGFPAVPPAYYLLAVDSRVKL